MSNVFGFIILVVAHVVWLILTHISFYCCSYSSRTDMGLTSGPHTRVASTLLPVAIHQSHSASCVTSVPVI